MTRAFRAVGKSARKLDGRGLVTGRATYTDDIMLPGMLQGAVLRSPHAHARIRAIDTRAAKAMPGVHAVLTWQDVPRIPFTTAGQGHPEPSSYDAFILDRKVRFVGDRVAAVAAETAPQAQAALAAISVDYEILPAVFTPQAARQPGAPVVHDEPEAMTPLPLPYEPQRNLVARVEMQLGDVARGLAGADHVAAAEFSSHYAAHCALERHSAVTWLDADGRLVIRCSTQVPFHVRRIVARALNLPVGSIRVIKPRLGGGFGGKQEIIIEDLCAALTLATRRPVRMVLTRAEQFMCARTRHPQEVRLRSGVKRDGTITALELQVLMNSGAYGTHGLTVLCNSGNKVLPLYQCANVRYVGETAYTNLPVGGAYRGYGATQSAFAVGVQLDELAQAIGMDTAAFLRRNTLRSGQGSEIFRALGEGKAGVAQAIGSCGLAECLDQVLAASGWPEKRAAYLAEQKTSARHKRGIGITTLMQGSSIPEVDMAAASLKLNDDGSFNLLMGATDLGTGADTVLSQIAAEELGVAVERIIPYSSDTDLTPFDVGAYASSTTYLSGGAVQKAARQVRGQILAAAARMLGVAAETLTLSDGIVRGGGKSLALAEVAQYTLYTQDQHQIAAHASHITHQSPPPFAAHVAEIELDTMTGRITVLHYVSATDCGTAINPALAQGQVEGAVLNGISFALNEEYLFSAGGRMRNASFSWYRIPGARDLPRLTTILVPTYEESGPCGAKSVSEIGINGALPVISNAVWCACGLRLRHAPFTPERVWRALRQPSAG